MNRTLFVGGLAWATTDESLHRMFQEYGEVEDARVIVHRDTGRSRGFGFVTMVRPEDAEDAALAIDGTKLDGRPVRVSEAEKRDDSARQKRPRFDPREPEIIRRGDGGLGGRRMPRKISRD